MVPPPADSELPGVGARPRPAAGSTMLHDAGPVRMHMHMLTTCLRVHMCTYAHGK